MRKTAVVFVLVSLILTACTPVCSETPGSPRLVTAIEASFDGDTITLHRQYTSSEKLRAVLDYIRCLEIYGTPESDTGIPASNCGKIVITFSDGTTKTYEQRGDQFLRQNNGSWHYINMEQAQEFPLLLAMMESD